MKEESTLDSEHDNMNAISHFYQFTYVSNSEKTENCLKLTTDLGPGTLAYFLQSA